jgi:hypothetical protein
MQRRGMLKALAVLGLCLAGLASSPRPGQAASLYVCWNECIYGFECPGTEDMESLCRGYGCYGSYGCTAADPPECSGANFTVYCTY